MPDIAVSVQAEPTDLRSWLTLARRLDSAGFCGLVMGDLPALEPRRGLRWGAPRQ